MYCSDERDMKAIRGYDRSQIEDVLRNADRETYLQRYLWPKSGPKRRKEGAPSAGQEGKRPAIRMVLASTAFVQFEFQDAFGKAKA